MLGAKYVRMWTAPSSSEDVDRVVAEIGAGFLSVQCCARQLLTDPVVARRESGVKVAAA
jgi:hypothetical protein